MVPGRSLDSGARRRYDRRRVPYGDRPVKVNDVLNGHVTLLPRRRTRLTQEDNATVSTNALQRHRHVTSTEPRHIFRKATRLAAFTPARSEADVNADLMAARLDISRVWSELTAADQEAICLSVLDGLDGPSAAGVLGITPVAFRLRLSRARRRLRALSDGCPSPSSLERTES